MQSAFLRVFTVSAAVSLLLLPLLLCRGWMERTYAPKTRWGLWLAVALVLLIAPWVPKPQAPVVVEAPAYRVTLPALPQGVRAEPKPQPGTPAGERTGPAAPEGGASGAVTPVRPEGESGAGASAEPSLPEPSAPQRPGVELTAVVSTLWLVGLVLILGRQGLWYLLARRRLLGAATPVAGLEPYAAELGVAGKVRFYRCRAISGPMTLGLWRPAVLLPQCGLAAAALRHELWHVKRHDVGYKVLLLCACALHWFNPLVWLMCRLAERDVESCCDAAVVAGQDSAYKRSYGELLLSAAAQGQTLPFTTSFGGVAGQMKSRLTQLFRPGRQSRALVCGVLALAVVLGSLVACRQEEKGEDPADTRYESAEYGFSLLLPTGWDGKYAVEEQSDQYGTFWTFYERESYEARPGERWGALFRVERESASAYAPEELKVGVSDGWGILGVRGDEVYRMSQPTDVTWLPGTEERYREMESQLGEITEKALTFFDPQPQTRHLTANTMPSLDYYDPEGGFLLYHTPTAAYFHYGDSYEVFEPDQSGGSRVLGRCDVSGDGRTVCLSDVPDGGTGGEERFYRWEIETRTLAQADSLPAQVDRMTHVDQGELFHSGFSYDRPLLSNVIKTADGTLVGLWIDYLMGDTIEYLRLIKETDSGQEESFFLTPELIAAPAVYTEPEWGFTLRLPQALEGQYVVSKAANWWGFYEKTAYDSGRGFLMDLWAEDSRIYEQSARAGQVLAVKDGITYVMDLSSPEDAMGIPDEGVQEKVLALLSALEGEMEESALDLSGVERSSGALWPLPYTQYGSDLILRPYGEGGSGTMDLYATDTVTVQCASDGVVVETWPAGDAVSRIVVDQGDGSFAVYAHLENAYVAVGERVTRGMILGLAGLEDGRRWLSFGRMEGESLTAARYVDPLGTDRAPITYRTYDFRTVSRDTLTFAEEAEIREAFRKVLEDVTDFWDTQRQEWRSVNALSENGARVTVKGYAVVDLDSDTVPEVVLWLDRDGDGDAMGSMVLRYKGGLIYGCGVEKRWMEPGTLKTDGTFRWSDGAGSSGIGRLDLRAGGAVKHFTDATVEHVTWTQPQSESYESQYYVDGYAAEREAWEAAWAQQEAKEDVLWQELP